MEENKHKLSPETLKAAQQASDFDAAIEPGGLVSPPKPKVTELPIHQAPMTAEDVAHKAESAVAPDATRWKKMLQPYAQKRSVRIGMAISGVCLLIVLGVAAGLFVVAKRPQLVANSSQLDQSTLYIDSNSHSVGVKANQNPSGLQVGSTVSTKNQGSANIRLGLADGTDPSLLMEDAQGNSWQVLGAGGSLKLIQGGQARATLDSKNLTVSTALKADGGLSSKGSTTLGNQSADTLTLEGSKIAIPNNLTFTNNALYLNGATGSVAVGTASTGGYKLLVAGSLKANGTIYTDGQVLATAGSAKNPGFAFNSNSNTGLYRPGLNVVGISAGGIEVVQIQKGSLITVGGANIEADGYLRGGRSSNNPAFQVKRFTGTLNSSGSAVVTDGLSTGYNRVLVIQAFYEGSGGTAVALNVDYVNSGNFQISGGSPNRPYRATMIYSQDGAGW